MTAVKEWKVSLSMALRALADASFVPGGSNMSLVLGDAAAALDEANTKIADLDHVICRAHVLIASAHAILSREKVTAGSKKAWIQQRTEFLELSARLGVRE